MKNPNCNCVTCGKPIYRSPRQIAKSKTGLFYCCKRHQRKWHLLKKTAYRKIAFDNLPHCCDECGYEKIIDILEVHHVNLDHDDNCLDNLQILCPTCHREIHYSEKTEAGMEFDYEPDWEE